MSTSAPTSYRPVIVLFSMTALMALAASFAIDGTLLTTRAPAWFIAFSMFVLALFKLQEVEKFSNMFMNYDLLAGCRTEPSTRSPKGLRAC